MREKILLGTSIAPHNIENQMQAVQSWLDCGFQVISYNSKEEMERLEALFPSVQFVTAKRDARAEKGRPLVYVYDVLQELKQQGNKICGIINSDIHLRHINREMYDFLVRESENSLVYGHRRDIEFSGENTGIKYIGIDFFLFDRDIINIYQDDGLVIGGVVWDYWLVFIAHHFGKITKELINPVAYHIRHPQTWRELDDCEIKKNIAAKYLGEKSFRMGEKVNTAVLENAIKVVYISHVSRCKVLIVINGELYGLTMKSLLRQTHENVEMIFGDIENAIRSDIEADFVFIPINGMVYNDIFLSHMLANTNGVEGVVTSFSVLAENKLFFNVHTKHITSLSREIFYGCSLVKPSMLKQDGFRLPPSFNYIDSNLIQIEYRDYVETVIKHDNRSKYYIWGAGRNTRYILDNVKLPHLKIVGIVDSNSSHIGKTIGGIQVFSKEVLRDTINYDAVIISPLQFEKEIYNQLTSLIPEDMIVCFGYSLYDLYDKSHTINEEYCMKDYILVADANTREILKSSLLKDKFIVEELNESQLDDDALERMRITLYNPVIVIISDTVPELKSKLELGGLVYMDHFMTYSDIVRLLGNSNGQDF